MLKAVCVAVVLAVLSISGGLAFDFTSPIASEAKQTGENKFTVMARGSSRLTNEIIRKAAFLEAANRTLASGSRFFRIVEARENTLRNRDGSGRNRSTRFEVMLDIQTHKDGDPVRAADKWFPAEKVVEKVGPEIKAVK